MFRLIGAGQLRREVERLTAEKAELLKQVRTVGRALAEKEVECSALRRKIQPRDPKTGRMLPKAGRP